MADLRLAIPVALIASTCAIIGAMVGLALPTNIVQTLLGATILFIVIRVMAGLFVLGAGWANVPVLNLLLGAPTKISVATTKFLLSITDTSAAWIHLKGLGIG